VPPPSTSTSTLTGVVERIIFLNEENHYTIADFRPDSAPASKERAEIVTIVGALPGVECGENAPSRRRVDAACPARRSVQGGGFQKRTALERLRHPQVSRSGLVSGIGKTYANKIVDAFGTDTFRVLSEESGKLRSVEGIGKKRAAAIKQAWDEKRTERELYIFLQTYGVTPSQCVKTGHEIRGAGETDSG